ncbi:hypothetical protein ACHHYP_15768 [Achlya hypogyna]|uniref:Uncharacterized protein n=1 Tax=Achlya hypogyna TaxID=1202772 RepID=A0A1V9ZEM4_ACHHY|nr:hypothetical protein ACHHYP_15768 [Achlya hypogyna]
MAMIVPFPTSALVPPPVQRWHRLETVTGGLYVLFTLCCSVWYVAYLTPCFTNDLWWPNYNLSGHQAFLIDLINHALTTTATASFSLVSRPTGVSKAYDDSVSFTDVPMTYSRQLVLHDLSSLPYAIANLRTLSASWSMRMNTQHCWVDFNQTFVVAHTARRLARCQARYATNAAVYMEATLRNVDWADFLVIWAGPGMPFTVALQEGLEETVLGRHWLATTATALDTTTAVAELEYWTSFGLTNFVLQWQNRWQTGVTETVDLVNALGMRLSTTVKSLARVDGPWTSQNLFYIPLNDLWVMQGLNRSLVWGTRYYVGVNVSAAMPAIPVEAWDTNFGNGVFHAQAALFHFDLGPYLSVDAFVRTPPPKLLAALNTFEAQLYGQLSADERLAAAYSEIPDDETIAPIPLAWQKRNYTFYGGNPMCVSNLPTSFVQQSFGFFDGCTQQVPLTVAPPRAAHVFAFAATGTCADAARGCNFAAALLPRLDFRDVAAQLQAAIPDIQSLDIVHMQYATTPVAWETLRAPFLHERDALWSYASWLLLYDWLVGLREVVSFEGDAATFVLLSSAYTPASYPTSGLGQVLQCATQSGLYLVLLVSVALVVVAALAVAVALKHRSLRGRNLFYFNRTVGASWVGRPLCLLRGLSAVMLLSTSSVALHGGLLPQFRSSPRHWAAIILLAGEATWCTYVLNELLFIATRAMDQRHCAISSAIAWILCVAFEVFAPVQASAALDRQCYSQDMDYIVECTSGTVHVGSPSRAVLLVLLHLGVVGATLAIAQWRLHHDPLTVLEEPSLHLSGAARVFLTPLPAALSDGLAFDHVSSLCAGLIHTTVRATPFIFDIKLWRLVRPKGKVGESAVRLPSARVQSFLHLDTEVPTGRSPRMHKAVAVLGLLQMFVALLSSVLYLDIAALDLTNNFYWSRFNASGGHAFIASWLNEQLVWGIPSMTLALDEPHIALFGTFDADVAYVASPSNNGARLQHTVLRSVEAAITGLRAMDGCDAPWVFTQYCYVDFNMTWEMAASFARQARCRAMTANGAVFLESLVRNVDSDTFDNCWGKAFEAAIGTELRQSAAGRAWLSHSPLLGASAEATYWRRHGISTYDTQWQNFKRLGVMNTYNIVNAYGLVYPLTLQRQNGSYRMASASSLKMYWGFANDLTAVGSNMSGIGGSSLVRSSSTFAYRNCTPFELLVRQTLLASPLSQGFTLLTALLGPFGTVDMVYTPVPDALLRAVRSIINDLRRVLTTSLAAQTAYAEITPLDSSYPVPPPWLGQNGITFGGSPLCPDVAYPAVVDIGLNNLFSYDQPCVPTTGVLAMVAPTRQHYIIAGTFATVANVSTSCQFDPTNDFACLTYLSQTQNFLKTYLPSAVADSAAMAAVNELRIGFINYGYETGNPPLELLQTQLLGDPTFSFFAWMYIYEWIAGSREVVSFEGDAGSLTLITDRQVPLKEAVQPHEVPVNLAQYARGSIVYVTYTMIGVASLVVGYVLVSHGYVEGANMFKFGHVGGVAWVGRPLLCLRSMTAICMLSTASPTLQFSGVVSYFADNRPWYKLVLAANEVTWLASIVTDICLVFTREYTSYYSPVNNAAVWSIAALLTTIAPVHHTVVVALDCVPAIFDLEIVCETGTITIGQISRLVMLVSLVLACKGLLAVATKRAVGPKPAPVAHSLFLSAGATYLFSHDHRSYNSVYYLDRASAAMDGLLTYRGSNGKMYVFDCKSWRTLAIEEPPAAFSREHHWHRSLQYACPLVD